MPLDPARALSAYLRAQAYQARTPATRAPKATAAAPDLRPQGGSAVAKEAPVAAPPETARPARPPGRFSRLLLLLRQTPAATGPRRS
ncbi:hypothetical protein ACFQ2B_01530 [Streptomyces stramineus]|uniref:Uncharacterized protein n=1 Tax=Streptomyces stramineus TaxID=173861 RepID=A0ABP3KE90_9ACTN